MHRMGDIDGGYSISKYYSYRFGQDLWALLSLKKAIWEENGKERKKVSRKVKKAKCGALVSRISSTRIP